MNDPTWHRVPELARDWAAAEVAATRSVRPTLFGFLEDDFLGAVELRPHTAGDLESPLIEALALLVPLGADRLAFLGGGRAWSLDDPIPPVSGAEDLRQQVAVLLMVDGHGHPRPMTSSVLMPFEWADGGPRWDDALEIDEAPEGPVPHLLMASAQASVAMALDDVEIGRQALRLLRLGHDLRLPGLDGDASLAGCLLDAVANEEDGFPVGDGRAGS